MLSPAMTVREVANAHKTMVANCNEHVQAMESQLMRDLDSITSAHSLPEYPEPVTKNDSPLKSAVGIVLKGCVIDSVLPGVPAQRVLGKVCWYAFGFFWTFRDEFTQDECAQGDTILEIDNVRVDASSATTALIGCDEPDSLVTIKFKKKVEDTSWGSSFVQEDRIQTSELRRYQILQLFVV